MAKKKKDNRGGYRENAKRPLKYGEPTVTVNYRIPASQRVAVDDIVKKFLKKYLDFVTQNRN